MFEAVILANCNVLRVFHAAYLHGESVCFLVQVNQAVRKHMEVFAIAQIKVLPAPIV